MQVDPASDLKHRIAGLFIHKLAVDYIVGAFVDVLLRPWVVGVTVTASAVPGEHLGLGQIGDISVAAKALERQLVADVGVAATVLQVELVVHGLSTVRRQPP